MSKCLKSPKRDKDHIGAEINELVDLVTKFHEFGDELGFDSG